MLRPLQSAVSDVAALVLAPSTYYPKHLQISVYYSINHANTSKLSTGAVHNIKKLCILVRV